MPVAAGQRITGSGVALLGTTSGNAVGVSVNLCFQLGAGAVNPFYALSPPTSTINSGAPRVSFAASGTVVPGAGTYKVGICVQNDTAVSLNNNHYVNGWFMVTN